MSRGRSFCLTRHGILLDYTKLLASIPVYHVTNMGEANTIYKRGGNNFNNKNETVKMQSTLCIPEDATC